MVLHTTAEVMDALGGNIGVAKLTGSSPSAVSNWRVNGRFPANTFALMRGALAKKGLRAPKELWGQK